GYIALWQAIEDEAKAARAAAILALVGVVNVPIIKFSVDWWNTLHQPASVVTMEGPKIHPDLLWPLLLMGIGFMALYLGLLAMRIRAELLERRV
ncbi:cytochrome c biogenesis protein CcsA, partial [Klebsiella pneumoniae]